MRPAHGPPRGSRRRSETMLPEDDRSVPSPAPGEERGGPARAPSERSRPLAEPEAEPGNEDWGSPRMIHKALPKGSIDRDASAVIHRLTRKGHTAYLVGGCVRDLLLGLRPKDFDIATSARPRQVKRIFRNCRVIGRRFRLAHIIFPGQKIIEVSTFRRGTESESSDDSDDLLIRDDNVFGTPEQDARRRDFTINGLFYDIQQGTVIDYVGGLHDIERRTLRMIGDPDIRLQEDPIRILRAIKFAARLRVNISPKTMRYVEDHRDKISRSAPPRILEEILRMSRGVASRHSFDLMLKTGILEEVLPDVANGIEQKPERVELYRRYLDRLDREIADGLEPTAPIVFGVYMLPLVFPESFYAEDSPVVRPDGLSTEKKIEEIVSALVPHLRLSRRDAGRLRQILMAQRRLAPAERKRRFSRSSIARQAYSEEAIALFGIHCHALDKWMEELERWRKSLAEVLRSRPRASDDRPGGPQHGKKRRRRSGSRRRRRRKKKSGAAGGN